VIFSGTREKYNELSSNPANEKFCPGTTYNEDTTVRFL